jgi:hypothetical protein
MSDAEGRSASMVSFKRGRDRSTAVVGDETKILAARHRSSHRVHCEVRYCSRPCSSPGSLGTHAEIVQRLNREVRAILETADFREKVASQGAEVTGSTTEQFVAFMRAEIAKWRKVTSRLKLQAD